MSGAELPLAIVGAVAAVDVAIKTVIETCSALHNAEKEVRERGTRLRSNCLAMKLQLEILRQTRNNFDEEGQKVQDDVLQILASKLDATETKLKSLAKCRSSTLGSDAFSAEFTMSKRERTKYATLKDRLDMAIDEVESWQRLSFNPLWFITLKSQTQQFDEDLEHARKQNPGKGNSMIKEAIAVRDPLQKASSTHVFLPPAKLNAAKIIEIAFSSVKLAQIEDRWRLLDSVSGLSKRTIRDLAVKLKHTKPSTFSLLTCFGAVHDDKNNEACLVFRTPEDMFDPETLRAKMLARNLSHSLSERFRLAMQLARAVCSVHTFGMVHKSIRPENIIVFRDRESILGTTFLLGFERLRREEDRTRLTGDTDRVKNLYRHPQRQGPKLRDPYVMQHDIYSLGVCLLEIGLWSSFVEYTNPTSDPVISQSYNLGVEGLGNTEYSEAVKTKLLALARDILPEKMGTKYSRVVETCLTCLDEGNEDFSDETEFQDEDGILVAIRYIEKGLTAINLDRLHDPYLHRTIREELEDTSGGRLDIGTGPWAWRIWAGAAAKMYLWKKSGHEAIAKFSHDRYYSWFVKSFGWYEDTTSIFITMEYCRHGDLHHYLADHGPVSATVAQHLTYQILEGLGRMHENGFAHRDLKPASRPPGEKWWIVLADFGISKRGDEGNGPTTMIKGTDGRYVGGRGDRIPDADWQAHILAMGVDELLQRANIPIGSAPIIYQK
ncbi:hypothetical protein DL770_006293 [Monosporascus sp. CRB-9-2]|nr:hypothetical protein DL770_006293 [Monosporascus sp. CRB-9-2]